MEAEAREKLLPDEQSDGFLQRFDARKTSHTLRAWCLIVLILTLCGISTILGIFVGSHASDRDFACLRRTSQESPLTPDIHIDWHKTRFNGSLLKENVYRQKPGPEVDAAWAALGIHYHSVIVPEDQAARVGLRPDQVHIRQKYGGGFPANVEGLHQLHCLNLVRQALYFNVDYYRDRGEGAFKNEGHIVKKHITHCLDIVRQQLMCTVDIGVLGQVWYDPASGQPPEAFVDFNTEHVCRNFDAVREWAEKYQIPEPVPSDYLEPPKEGDRVFHTIP